MGAPMRAPSTGGPGHTDVSEEGAPSPNAADRLRQGIPETRAQGLLG